jgi:adenine-specific DNA-methyltransferase
MMLENRIWWGLDGKNKPRLKIFRCEVDDGVVPSTWWTREQAGDNQDAKRELRTLFDGVEVFDTPKPTRLLERILDIATSGEQGEIVLDFFAGSGTTGDAVMRKNASDGGVRRHISVQLPEELEPPVSLTKGPQLKTISDVTKERLRRAAKSIAEENLGSPGDTGFRVFKLHTSNIRAWDPARDDIARSLEDAAEHLRADRTEQDILFELLLKLGLDLTVPIEAKQIAGKSVHSIGAGVLMVCLDKKIGPKDVEPLAHGIAVWHKALSPAGETTIVFRDSAFVDDVAKTNISAILQQHGLENLRSL